MKPIATVLYGAFLIMVVMLGWSQPLKYRFMSRQAQEAMQAQPAPNVALPPPSVAYPSAPAAPTPHGQWMYDQNRSNAAYPSASSAPQAYSSPLSEPSRPVGPISR